jgi:hypothetical protein
MFIAASASFQAGGNTCAAAGRKRSINQLRVHRAMMTFMISLVPAEGPRMKASRKYRVTAYSSMQP